jgi:ATP-binding cassette subfamily B protein
MWRLCKLGYRHEPRLMVVAFVLSQLAALPDALLALWLMLLGKGVLEHRPGMVKGAAIGLGVSTAATWFLRTVSTRVQRATASLRRHHRASGTPGVSRSPVHAPQSGVRA